MKIKTWQVAVVVVLMIFFVDHFSRIKAQTPPAASARFTETDCTALSPSETVCSLEDTKTTNHWVVVHLNGSSSISRND